MNILLTIKGIAERTVSYIKDWLFGMKQAGVSNKIIERQLKDEVEAGRIIAEMRNFAQTQIPGFVGEAINRFAQKSLQDRQKDAKQKLLDARNKLAGIPEPLTSDELDDLFYWITIHDSKVCDICEANHGKIKTLRQWSGIGIPRSGACKGRLSCRCLLIPATMLTANDVPQSIILKK